MPSESLPRRRGRGGCNEICPWCATDDPSESRGEDYSRLCMTSGNMDQQNNHTLVDIL